MCPSKMNLMCLSGLFLAVFCAEGQVPQGPARRTFTHERDVQTSFWQNAPRWEGNRLLGVTNNRSKGPIIFTIDSDGRKEDTLFALQDAAEINIMNAALSASGEVAIAGSAVTNDTRGATFVALMTADRKGQIVTRTWPYCPMVVTFAPDGNIWTFGHLKDDADTREIAKNVLQRFDSSGRFLGSRTLHVKGTDVPDSTYVRASRDRVGWFTRANEYIEFALDGTEIARYDGPDGAEIGDMTGLAISMENEVVVSRFGHGKAEFLTLDRGAHAWSPVALSTGIPTWARVLGFDGTTVVTNSENGRMRRYRTK